MTTKNAGAVVMGVVVALMVTACGSDDPTLVPTDAEPTVELVTPDPVVADVADVDAGLVDAGVTKPGRGPKCDRMLWHAKTKHCP